MDLPAACVRKTQNAMAVMRITVLTATNAKTENAPLKEDFQVAMLVNWIAKKDC